MSEDVCEFCCTDPATHDVLLELKDGQGKLVAIRSWSICAECWEEVTSICSISISCKEKARKGEGD